ncbi:hypothetical protein [Tengunoibacter tsumagoiensis]|uniref:Uncharacterized protein n=1 Tax=Tengunoibacter tsumagoiensis TaxID=2014871 RepID=A0A401ZY78_9CHLR|nr:hypothetical protein [Tengunoibacter tsumagoiensis]GCE11799.1 hypothetical protein KTT_16580 [Tengunoibacter tsumagoiensis]
MKAVAVALVLIAGAAVVLWFANTLNSWVLGGLIGGLAALLLSIPITLTLFSYLSRRHDERLRTEAREEEELFLARAQQYRAYPTYLQSGEQYASLDFPRVLSYEDDEPEYVDAESASWYEDEDDWYVSQPPQELRREQLRQLPPPRQVEEPTRQLKQISQQGSSTKQVRSRTGSQRGRETTGRLQSAAFPGYQVESSRSQFQSQALRTARLEAVRKIEQDEDRTIIQRPPAKRSMTTRHERMRALRQKRAAERSGYQDRSRLEGSLKRPESKQRHQTDPAFGYSLPPSLVEGESMTHPQYEYGEPRTTDLDPDASLEQLNRPHLRKAPYMYDDDPLRQEMSQHVDEPITRRSSRNLAKYRKDQ